MRILNLIRPSWTNSESISRFRKVVDRFAVSCSASLVFFCLLFAKSAQGQSPPGNVTLGLNIWYDAGDIDGDGDYTNNPPGGTEITTWVDKSGAPMHNATIATGKSGAILETSPFELINGHPVLKFNRTGASNGSIYTTGLDIRASVLEDVTVILVYKPKSSRNGVQQSPWGVDNGSWDRFYYSSFRGTNNINGIVSNGTGPIDIDDGNKLDEVYLHTTAYNGRVTGSNNRGPVRGSAVYFNGNLVQTFRDVTHPTNAFTQLAIGWDGDNGAFDGQIAEFLVYDRILTPCELERINSALGLKYGEDFSDFTGSYDFSSPFNIGVNAIGIAGSVCGTNVQVDEASSHEVRINNPSSNDMLNEFLIFGHNDVASTSLVSDVPTGATVRVERAWRVEEETNAGVTTGVDLGEVDIRFDMSTLGIADVGIHQYVLLVDDDGLDFSNSSLYSVGPTMLFGSYAGGFVTFSGVNLNHLDYFTIAVFDQDSPNVTVEQAVDQNDPAYCSSDVVFTVTFSEPVDPAPLTCSDFNVTGTASATCSGLTEVAPFDYTTYEVVISATSDGIVIVDLPRGSTQDSDSNDNLASTSIDNEVTVSASIDSDEDGYPDNCDLDDDNDGILDTDECPDLIISDIASALGDSMVINGVTVKYLDGGVGSGTTGFGHGVFWNEEGQTAMHIAPASNSDKNAPGWRDYTYILLEFSSPVTPGDNFGMVDIDGDINWEMGSIIGFNAGSPVIPTYTNIGANLQESTYSVINPIPGFSFPASISACDTRVSQVEGIDQADPASHFTADFGANTVDQIVIMYAQGGTSLTPTNSQFSGVHSKGLTTIPELICDADGDGILNPLDLDSDDDGCPDALEGDGGFIYANIESDNTLTGAVDTDGIPNLASGGQAVGSSQDALIQAAECDPCASGSSLFTDNDLDGIGDICDLDDDNDGLTDEQECPSSSSNIALNANATQSSEYSTPFPASNAVDGNLTNFQHTQSNTPNAWLDIDLGSVQNINKIVIYNRTGACCQGRASNAYLMVSNTPFPASTDVNDAFPIAEQIHNLGNMDGVLIKPFDIGMMARYVRVQLPGAAVNQNLNLAEVQVLNYSVCDTDNDLVPDYVDLDSDNDGIYDVVEGGDSVSDSDGNGRIDASDTGFADTNMNGMADAAEATLPVDSDTDGNIDAIELDSDGDGCLDVREAKFTDINRDGRLGPSPITVNSVGVVTSGSDGYTGTLPPVTDDTDYSSCPPTVITNRKITYRVSRL